LRALRKVKPRLHNDHTEQSFFCSRRAKRYLQTRGRTCKETENTHKTILINYYGYNCQHSWK